MSFEIYSQLDARDESAGGSHAIVIGGSLAGLLAARVLADHFARVTVVERDSYPEDAPAPRKGVPQSRHVHVLMLRGRRILEKLFPGLAAELIAAGALEIDMAGETAWLTPAGWGARYNSGLKMLTFTRELLDWHVRHRLTAHERVRLLVGCEVSRLLPATCGRAVAGVAIRSRRLAESAGVDERVLPAELVIDASGRGSRAERWLQELGSMPPAETVVSAFLGYASRLYRRPPEFRDDGQMLGQGDVDNLNYYRPPKFRGDWKSVYLQAAPPERTRAAVLFPVEGDRWLLTLCGGGKDYPPTDEAGFLEFARSLPSPLVYDTIKDAEPLSPIYGFRATENRWRHYEELRCLPENFLTIGDAACAFNPVYGQGMSIAALGALALDETLRKHRRRPDGSFNGLARSFQKRLAKVNSAPWLLATGED
ncbi:MAG: 2-polyprenyl-6-methoxyphenol hydroxylase-like oxidoreductase, partial [Acidobacteriota bacterium]|nr:2-polyprenyl-6-methoxyphenol hydroxylase-like oxidoreductase [Acidobacteriota bacterium]